MMHGIVHFIWHCLAWTWGGDGQGGGNGEGYLFFSGPLADLSILGAVLGWYYKHNCHSHRCWRLGKHPVEGTPYVTCSKHHPDIPDQPTSVDIRKHYVLASGSGDSASNAV